MLRMSADCADRRLRRGVGAPIGAHARPLRRDESSASRVMTRALMNVIGSSNSSTRQDDTAHKVLTRGSIGPAEVIHANAPASEKMP